MKSEGNGLTELAKNAGRLLADAELLFANGSHQTAVSLAILAMEEVGKFFQLKWRSDLSGEKLPARGARAHQAKQATAGSFYAAQVSIDATKEFVRSIGFPDDDVTLQHFLTAIHMPDERARKALDKLVSFVAEKMANDDDSKIMFDARMGLMAMFHFAFPAPTRMIPARRTAPMCRSGN